MLLLWIYVFAGSVAFTRAACTVVLSPHTEIAASTIKVGCKFQVVVATEEEWMRDMLVCIWPDRIAGLSYSDVPETAQCIHSVVGNALFDVTMPGSYTLNAAIVQGSVRTRVSETTSITVDATRMHLPSAYTPEVSPDHPKLFYKLSSSVDMYSLLCTCLSRMLLTSQQLAGMALAAAF
jgi:hypothetical protein